MNAQEALKLLRASGVVQTGHFVGTSGRHFDIYIAKDCGTRLPSIASALCLGIAERFTTQNIEVVVAPAVGGIVLSQWTARHLSALCPQHPEVIAVYAEHEEEIVAVGDGKGRSIVSSGNNLIELALENGHELVIKKPTFGLKRGFAKDVKGRRVLIVEDTLTTGNSVRNVTQAVTAAGGILVGVGVLVNGGNVTAESLEVPRLDVLAQVDRHIYSERECAERGLCAQGIGIDTKFGHGEAFLNRRGRQINREL